MNVGSCICLLLLNGWVWYCPVEMLWNVPCSRPRIDNCKRTPIKSHFSKSRAGDYFLECNLFKDSTAILLSSFQGSLQNGWLLGASQQRHPSVSTWLRIPKKSPHVSSKIPECSLVFWWNHCFTQPPLVPEYLENFLGIFGIHLSNEKNPGRLGYIGIDSTTQLYRDYSKKTWNNDPY